VTLDPSLLASLAGFSAPTIANGLAGLGVAEPLACATGPEIRGILPALGRRVGVAVTAVMDTTSPGEDRPTSRFVEWLERIAANRRATGLALFAVIESVGPWPARGVTMGDTWARLLQLGGVVGCLTNGCVRDLAGVARADLACWAAGVTAAHGRPGRVRWQALEEPVTISGVSIRPGDLIHADDNGCVVIRPEHVAATLEQAQVIARTEEELFARLFAPGFTLDDYLRSR
jgi:hypothetical protein